MEVVLLKGAPEAFGSQAELSRCWADLGYTREPDFDRGRAESKVFKELLEGLGVTTLHLPSDPATGPDSLYVRDASIVCSGGAILCGMGKAARAAEPPRHVAAYEELGVPILGRIQPPGTLEGGDVTWLDPETVLVGRGYRTNDEGIGQLRALLDPYVNEIVVVPLPHHRGPEDVFHLMSILSPVDDDLAVVYSPLMPVPLRELLMERGFELVEVPAGEFNSLGCNVLAVAPRVCVMHEGNPLTRERLRAAGAVVHEYTGRAISIPGQGGPTCLTRPVRRT